MGLSSSAPSGPPAPAGYNPYATGPYAAGVPGHPGATYGTPVAASGGVAMMMSPEQLHHAMMIGASPMAAMAAGVGYPVPTPPSRVAVASTVRNQVVLKKSTLQLLFKDAEPQRLYLDFRFTAAVPCAVTVLYGFISREPAPRLGLLERLEAFRYPHCRRRTLFPAGEDLVYSQAVHLQEWLDTRAFTHAELTNVPNAEEGGVGEPSSTASADSHASAGGYERLPPFLYPLVIAIEALGEGDEAVAAAAAAPAVGGAGAAVRSCGLELPGKASNMQVTYATLVHRPGEDAKAMAARAASGGGDSAASSAAGASVAPPPSGGVGGMHPSADWRVKPIRQRLQLEGQSFELREIYGMDKTTGAGSAASSSADASGDAAAGGGSATSDVLASGSDCVVCLSEKRDTTVLPCRHMCMCYECAQQLRFAGNKCPICRTNIETLLRITIDNHGGDPSAGSATA